MPRNMSFYKTQDQVRNMEKYVTRRMGWRFLKPGDIIQPIVKGQGLKKGEHVEYINGPIKIISTRSERIDLITKKECILEGFPGMTPDEFIEMFCKMNHCKPGKIINRIEFEYLLGPSK